MPTYPLNDIRKLLCKNKVYEIKKSRPVIPKAKQEPAASLVNSCKGIASFSYCYSCYSIFFFIRSLFFLIYGKTALENYDGPHRSTIQSNPR